MNDCVSWAALSDRVAVGEELSPQERLYLRSHPSGCVECAAEAQLWESLGNVLEDPALLTRAPRVATTPPRQAWRDWFRPSRARSRRSVKRSLVAAGALAAAAASAAVGAHFSGLGEPEAGVLPNEVGARTAPALSPARTGRARLALASGRVFVDGQMAGAGQPLSVGGVVSVEDGQACILAPPGVTACLEIGTKLSIEVLDADKRRFRLHRGHVVAHLERQPIGSSFGFETSAGSVVAKGTVFSLNSDGSAVTLRVHEGVVLNDQGTRAMPYQAPSAALLSQGKEASRAVDPAVATEPRLIELAKYFNDRGQSSLLVTAAAGSSVSLGDVQLGAAPLSALVVPGQYRMEVARDGFASIVEKLEIAPGMAVARNYEATPELSDGARGEARASRTKTSTPAKLLEQARSLRADAHYREALSVYQRLLREYAKSSEAQVALVSLGELQLSQLGDSAGALRSFEAYLRGGGALSQEASYGRIRALRRLGRLSEAQSAADAFVKAYPKSVQAATLRKELP